MQSISGIVGAFERMPDGARTETAYRARLPFGAPTVVLIVAVAIYSRSKDVKPSDQLRDSRQRRIRREHAHVGVGVSRDRLCVVMCNRVKQ